MQLFQWLLTKRFVVLTVFLLWNFSFDFDFVKWRLTKNLWKLIVKGLRKIWKDQNVLWEEYLNSSAAYSIQTKVQSVFQGSQRYKTSEIWWKCKLFLKFIYSEKATKFCEIITLLLSYVVLVKSKVNISQNFLAFSEYMNFNILPFYFSALLEYDFKKTDLPSH